MNVSGLCFSSALLFLMAVPAHADVMYQCVDASGHKSFSNIRSTAKGAQCTAMDLGPAAPLAAPSPGPGPGPSSSGASRAAAKTVTPAAFPRVDDNAQKGRDTDRRRILEGELAAEQRSLEQARKDLAEQDATILPSERMQGGGISGGKVDERMQPYRDKAALHARNIEAIQKEISKLR